MSARTSNEARMHLKDYAHQTPRLWKHLVAAGLLACGSRPTPVFPKQNASVTRMGEGSPLTVAGAAPE